MKRKAIDYKLLLSKAMQRVPAYKDFAQAINEVFAPEIDQRRQKLEKLRDSVKYRRGDVLTNFEYNPEISKPAINIVDNTPVNIPIGYVIKEGIVKNVINNIYFYNSTNDTDYVDIAFTYNRMDCRWLKPIDLVQEREILLKNSYIMGFDFFNTKLDNDDLQRLYENIQAYWPESGADDNFIDFIGFIKNTKFNLIALWTEDSTASPSAEDDPNVEYPYLEPFDEGSMVSVKNGGKQWETSHVEMQYDLAQFQQYYIINLDDVEELFYYFAPIMLVLERITGRLEVNTPILGINSYDLTAFEYGSIYPTTKLETGILGISSVSMTNFQYGDYNIPKSFTTNIPILGAVSITLYMSSNINTKRRGCMALSGVVDLAQNCFDFTPYVYSTTGV